MKVSYSIIKNRASSHCITWLYRKKRHRKFFNNRIEALLFKHQKEAELGYRENSEIDLELVLIWFTRSIINLKPSRLAWMQSRDLLPVTKSSNWDA